MRCDCRFLIVLSLLGAPGIATLCPMQAQAQTQIPSAAESSVVADDRLPVAGPYTTYARYEFPGECQRAATWGDDMDAHTQLRDTVFRGRDGRPAHRASVADARACVARFTVERVPSRELVGLGAAYLAAEQDSLATLAFTRLDHLLAHALIPERAWARQLIVRVYLDAAPAHVVEADRYLRALDSMGVQAAMPRMLAHYARAITAHDRDDQPVWDREAQATLTAFRQLSLEDRREYASTGFGVYEQLVRLRARQNDLAGANAFLGDLSATVLPLNPRLQREFQRLRAWIEPQGSRATTLQATRWFNVAAGDTVHPAPGRPTLIAFAGASCQRCGGGFAVLRRLAARYGRQLDIAMSVRTGGYFDDRLVAPDSEVALIRHQLMDELHLPVALAVWRTPMGRRDDGHVTVLSAPNWQAYPMPPVMAWVVYLVDKTGKVRLLTELGSRNEALLSDVIKEMIDTPATAAPSSSPSSQR